MAQINYRTNVLQHATMVMPGTFFPNGSSAVDNTLNEGEGFSVARTSSGLFTLTTANKWVDLVAGVASFVCSGSLQDVKTQLGQVSMANKTVQIRLLTTGTPVDAAADDGTKVSFTLVLRNSSSEF